MNAWIEIRTDVVVLVCVRVAFYMNAWIEMQREWWERPMINRRILYECVD